MKQDELVRENQAQRREIKKQAEIIERQSRVIHAADKMHDAARMIPRKGFSANEQLAETADGYQAAKDVAKGEQEG